MEDVIFVKVLESLRDLLGHSLLILESSGYVQQIRELKMEIHDHIDLMIQISALRPLLVDDVRALNDVSMVEALQAGNFSQTTEIYPHSVVDVRRLVKLHGHVIGAGLLFSPEKILEEIGADTFLALKKKDLTVVT